MNQRTGLLPRGRGQGLELRLDFVRPELVWIECSHALTQAADVGETLRGEDFLHGRLVKREILVEEVAHPVRQLAPHLDLFLHNREGGSEVGVVELVRQDVVFLQDGDSHRLERVQLQRAEVLAVDPEKLVRIEPRVGAIDLRQVELGDDLLDGDDLAIVLGRPAEQAEVVPHRGGQVALVDVVLDRGARVALAHL